MRQSLQYIKHCGSSSCNNFFCRIRSRKRWRGIIPLRPYISKSWSGLEISGCLYVLRDQADDVVALEQDGGREPRTMWRGWISFHQQVGMRRSNKIQEVWNRQKNLICVSFWTVWSNSCQTTWIRLVMKTAIYSGKVLSGFENCIALKLTSSLFFNSLF